ncbi:PEP-CTERM protein-sorting domain-containing protein [Asanoa ishikariensis]|uniref:PEP-CTERM protein-sorting domain-containing protein n=1 Tax=Asanoa ishikariensis TaxID=137265 RepID=A0A1H3RNM6_9ACTN|nr:DUF2784 domain-containing protein [Asanoa ishikariensis]SDZ27223.1 PEP-CTERM protein-sorting domain-containing protein [Asanoa ishikariensis]
MGWKELATVFLGLHFAFVAYVLFGGFLAWKWPKAIWFHLPAVGWGIALIGFGLNCPLTYAQNWALGHAGEPPLTRGFVDTYIEGILYPERYVHVAQAILALIVLVSYVGFFVLRRRRKSRAEAVSMRGQRVS